MVLTLFFRRYVERWTAPVHCWFTTVQFLWSPPITGPAHAAVAVTPLSRHHVYGARCSHGHALGRPRPSHQPRKWAQSARHLFPWSDSTTDPIYEELTSIHIINLTAQKKYLYLYELWTVVIICDCDLRMHRMAMFYGELNKFTCIYRATCARPGLQPFWQPSSSPRCGRGLAPRTRGSHWSLSLVVTTGCKISCMLPGMGRSEQWPFYDGIFCLTRACKVRNVSHVQDVNSVNVFFFANVTHIARFWTALPARAHVISLFSRPKNNRTDYVDSWYLVLETWDKNKGVQESLSWTQFLRYNHFFNDMT